MESRTSGVWRDLPTASRPPNPEQGVLSIIVLFTPCPCPRVYNYIQLYTPCPWGQVGTTGLSQNINIRSELRTREDLRENSTLNVRGNCGLLPIFFIGFHSCVVVIRLESGQTRGSMQLVPYCKMLTVCKRKRSLAGLKWRLVRFVLFLWANMLRCSDVRFQCCTVPASSIKRVPSSVIPVKLQMGK